MPFNSFEMKNFVKEFGFQMKTSSPEYPQSNCQSERAVGTVKQLMHKALEENNDVRQWYGLLSCTIIDEQESMGWSACRRRNSETKGCRRSTLRFVKTSTEV